MMESSCWVEGRTGVCESLALLLDLTLSGSADPGPVEAYLTPPLLTLSGTADPAKPLDDGLIPIALPDLSPFGSERVLEGAR